MSLLDANLQEHQYLAARYPTNLEVFPAAAPSEMASIDLLVRALEGEADWDLAGLIGGLNLGSRPCIGGNYGRFLEWGAVVSEFVPSSVPDLRSFGVQNINI